LKTAQIALDRLHNHYRDHPGLTQAIYEVGCTFSNAGQFGEAAQELNQVITRWPNSDYALKSKVKFGLMQVRQGNGQAAEATYQKIMTDYANHPKLAEAIDLMAEGYLDQGIALEKAEAKRVGSAEYAKIVREKGRAEVVQSCYRRAIEKWRIIIEKLPPTVPQAARAWYFTGVAYRRHLGDAEKAIPYYQKVVETWPDYEYAWSAQSMLALCYETLVRSGKITQESAEPKMEQAYKNVLERYSDCSLAAQTYLNLSTLYLNKGQWDQAAAYLQPFLERYPQAKQWPEALILLAITYERRGKPEIAAELYRSYLQNGSPDDPFVKMVQAKLEEQKEVRK
jgi:TolA-binding protein